MMHIRIQAVSDSLRSGLLLIAGCAALTALTVATAAQAGDASRSMSGDAVPVTWEHRHATFNYFSVTVLYECDALEAQVSRILKYLGARRDLKVQADCPLGPNVPSHNAWVNADFYVPVPASGGVTAETAPARWTTVKLTPRAPGFMGMGDCELMQAMKKTVMKDFSVRALDYATSCYPNDLSFDDFDVHGETLKAAL